jgi:iron complex outermembrane receptor protein
LPVEYLAGGSGVLVGGPAINERLVAQQDALGPWKFASHAFTGILPQDVLNPVFCEAGSPRPFTPKCNRDFNKSTWLRTFGVINRTEVDFGGATLKNIAAYRRAKRDSFQGSWLVTFADGSGGPGNHSITGSPDSPVESITEELQLSGRSFDNRLNWTTGAFYLHERGKETNYSFQSIGLAVSNTANLAPATLRTNSWGLYGQGTLAVTDKLNLTAGVRYSYDRKKALVSNININTVDGGVACSLFDANNVRLPGNPTECQMRGDKHWDAITWNFSADYDVAPGTMVYGTVSRGYRSGSFFPRAIRPSLFDYDPEYITNLEAGVKSDWRLAGRPIRTNLSVYLSKQTDMQVQVQDATTVPLSGYINNAGKSQYWGGEFETTFRLTDELTLSGYASYTDFKYKEYLDNNGTDLSYQTPPQPISHWNLSASAEYRVPLEGDSALVFRGDLTWTSKVVTANQLPNLKGDWNQPAYTLINVRADWEDFLGKPIDLGVWVTNLANDWYSWGGTCLNGSCFSVPSPPRMWGVDLKYRF